MDVSRSIELSSVSEIKILQNVRLISRRDLDPIYSKDNFKVMFTLSGEIRGTINCFLCLDGYQLSSTERNFIFPLFVESMNILIGKQISQDKNHRSSRIQLSAPTILKKKDVSLSHGSTTQEYTLELDNNSFSVLTQYDLNALN